MDIEKVLIKGRCFSEDISYKIQNSNTMTFFMDGEEQTTPVENPTE